MFNKTSGGVSAGARGNREVSQAQRRGATPAPGPGVADSSLSLDGRRQSSSHQAASPIGHVSAGSPLQLGNGAQGAVLQRSAGTPNSDTQREPQGVTYGAHFRDMRAHDYVIPPGANPARPQAYSAETPLSSPGGFEPSQSYLDAAARINGGMNKDTLESLGGGKNPTWRPGFEQGNTLIRGGVLQDMVLVKRTFIAEQLNCYIDEQAVKATVKKEFEDCVADADKAFEKQLALQNTWKALVDKTERSRQKKAKLQRQAANLRKDLFPDPPQ